MALWQQDEEDDHDRGNTPDDVVRHHTDCQCLVVFLAALAGLGYVFVYALSHGTPSKYAGLPLKNGDICGVSEAVVDKPFLFFCKDDEGKLSYDKAVCVAGCGEQGCASDGIEPEYTAEPFAGLLCLPDVSASQDLASQALEQVSGNENVKNLLEVKGVLNAWPILASSAGAAIIAGFLYLFLLEKFARCFVWAGMIILITTTGAFGGGMVYISQQPGGLDGLPSTGDRSQDLAIGAVVLSICGICTCVALCKRKSVDQAIDCVKSAAECIEETPSLLVEPLLALAGKLVVGLVLLVGFVYLLACADGISTSSETGIQIKYSHEEYAFIGFYIFMMLWIMEVCNAVSTFVVAYTAQLWFFQKGTACAVTKGYFAALWYHLGTLAFGAFLIALLRGVRIILSVLTEAMKDTGNQVGRLLVCCCNCIVGCFERFLEKINKFAYFDVAINSNSFCTAAGHAMSVLTNNATAAVTLHGATFLFEIAGVGSITAAGSLFTYLMSTQVEAFNDPSKETYVESPESLTIVSAVICFFLSLPFMLVFSTVADCVLFCYALERRRTPLKEEAKGFIRHFTVCWDGGSKRGRAEYDASRHPKGTQSLIEKVKGTSE